MKKVNLTVAAILMVLMSLAACAAPATSVPTSAPAATTAPTAAPAATTAAVVDDEKPLAEPYKVKVAGLLNANATQVFVALEKGFFLKHGILAEIKVVSSGQEAAKALSAGDVVAAFSATNNFQAEIASGIKHVAVMVQNGDGTGFFDSNLAIVGRADSGVRADHPEDLKGKTIGTQLGGSSEVYPRAIFSKLGIDGDKDVKWVNVNPVDQAAALKSKSVDVVSCSEPFTSQMLMDIPGSVVVIRGGGYTAYASLVIVEEKTIKEKPDLVLRIVAAYAEASAYVRQNPQDSGVVLSHWMQGLDPKVAGAALPWVKFDPRMTEWTLKTWDYTNNLLVEQKRIPAPIPAEGVFDTTFIQKIQKDHPEYFKDLKAATDINYKIK